MKRKLILLSVVMTLSIMLCGCTVSKESADKVKDLDYTVVGIEEQPDELKDIISEKGDDTFQISYVLGADLYVAVGYGKQESGGYSISVNEFYETAENLYLDTSLIGPGSAENVTDTPTTPYIVIKTENISDKPIEFN